MLALVDEQVLASVDDGIAPVGLEPQEIATDLVGDVSPLSTARLSSSTCVTPLSMPARQKAAMASRPSNNSADGASRRASSA